MESDIGKRHVDKGLQRGEIDAVFRGNADRNRAGSAIRLLSAIDAVFRGNADRNLSNRVHALSP